MENLKIPNAPKTPGVNFDVSTGNFFVSGISVPEDSRGFYEPILNWLKDYIKAPAESTTLDFKLSYVNTSSLQFIYDLLMQLDGADGDSTKVVVNWYYLEDDIDMQEMGEDFKDATNIKFNFFGVEDV
ncbi:DUF1987 domain-containing protein [Vicingaceae bacterium]|nr:DUF1987 domain-containing protein [Vicingaceae bacterium]